MGRPRQQSVSYFNWLYNQVRGGDYQMVCELMHSIIFKIAVSHDENRVGDVAEFRQRFVNEFPGIPEEELAEVMSPNASIFEVLVGLALRGNFQNNLPIQVWFGIFLRNLGLTNFDDYRFRVNRNRAFQILRTFNDRTYQPNGQGGLFPLRRPKQDQREVELWYQMGAYLTENELY
jgi:hypothetical protein